MLDEIFRLYGQKDALILQSKVSDLKVILERGASKVEDVLKTHVQAKATTSAHV